MTVQELMEQLEQMDPTMEVLFQYNYGDHWRTQVAVTVDQVEDGRVTYSDYHQMDRVVDEEDFDYDESGEPQLEGRAVVLLG